MTDELFRVVEEALQEIASHTHRSYTGGPGDGVEVPTETARIARAVLPALADIKGEVERLRANLDAESTLGLETWQEMAADNERLTRERDEALTAMREVCDEYPSYWEMDPLRKVLGLPLYTETLGLIRAAALSTPTEETSECPTCGSDNQAYRNPIGNHADEDSEPDYEWCRDRWHEPFYFTPPIDGQEARAATPTEEKP